MLYRGQYYYFDKNTLGDIIAIRDSNRSVVARYTYDAWGNHTVYGKKGGVDRSKTSIGNVNPFRYRGYYYDTETGFYYLQTRYYDPTICRFINADNYELVAELSQTVGQLNLYAYANNNPIMLTDETGESVSLALLIGSFLYGAIASGISQYLEDGTVNLVEAGVDGAFTAISVGLAATSIGRGASMAIGGAMGAVQYGIKVAFFDEKFSWDRLAYSVVYGIFSGAVSGAGAKNANALSSAIAKNQGMFPAELISYMMKSAYKNVFFNLIDQEFGTAVVKIGATIIGPVIVNCIKKFYIAD